MELGHRWQVNTLLPSARLTVLSELSYIRLPSVRLTVLSELSYIRLPSVRLPVLSELSKCYSWKNIKTWNSGSRLIGKFMKSHFEMQFLIILWSENNIGYKIIVYEMSVTFNCSKIQQFCCKRILFSCVPIPWLFYVFQLGDDRQRALNWPLLVRCSHETNK